jgi:hypothetical protein
VLLIIADISGYTRYMTANAKTLSHSQVIITELVEAIIHEIELPLEVAKLEGDAVFLFCRKRASDHKWDDTRRVVAGKLLTFFRKFSAKVVELSESTTCTCNACTHIERLRLKVIVHSGEALFHHVFNFLELAGVDVILVHRLLKNSVAANQYLLMTESAVRDLEFPEPLILLAGEETYDDIGRVITSIYLPEGSDVLLRSSSPSSPVAAHFKDVKSLVSLQGATDPFGTRFRQSWRLYWKLWFAPFARNTDPRSDTFKHTSNSTNAAQRAGFAVLTLLLTPFIVPVAALFVLRHAANPTESLLDRSTHPAGCDCGHRH